MARIKAPAMGASDANLPTTEPSSEAFNIPSTIAMLPAVAVDDVFDAAGWLYAESAGFSV